MTTVISQADYGTESIVAEMNTAAVGAARRAAAEPDFGIRGNDPDAVQPLADDGQVLLPQIGWTGVGAGVTAQQILRDKIVRRNGDFAESPSRSAHVGADLTR